jgi:hypothetical protein
MSGVRRAPAESVPIVSECCRCGRAGRRWDRIAGRAYCPNCEEALAQGEGQPLRARLILAPCSVCHGERTVIFHTFPPEGAAPVEMDLCPEHLRGLLSRRLGAHAFHQLQRQLRLLDVAASDIFLLHEEFYDPHGRARHPIYEAG